MKTTPRRALEVAYWAAVAALFSWAAFLRVRAPVELIADPDVWGYLSPAVNLLLGNGFTHTGRHFSYPGFLFLLLKATGDFRAIAWVQHALGLAAGGLILALWRRVLELIEIPSGVAQFYRWLGLIPAALFLGAADSIYSELQLRPESVCAFLGALHLYLLTRFVDGFFRRKEKPASVVFGVGVLFSAFLFATVRPSFWFAMLGTMMVVSAVFFRATWRREQIVIGGAAIAAILLFVLPERRLSVGDEVEEAFVPTLLFAQHADIISEQMARDLTSGATLPFAPAWVAKIHENLAREIAKSSAADPRHYPSLGFDPEYLMYRPDSTDAQLRKEFHDGFTQLAAFYRFYYFRALRHQPWQMAKKIGAQVAIFYRVPGGAYWLEKKTPLASNYAASARAMTSPFYWPVFSRYQPAVDFVARCEALSMTAPPLVPKNVIRTPLRKLAQRYNASLLLAFILSAIVLLRRAPRRRLGWLAAAVLLLYGISFATCFETAIVNSLEVLRYMTVQFIFALLAQSLTAIFALECARQLLRARRAA